MDLIEELFRPDPLQRTETLAAFGVTLVVLFVVGVCIYLNIHLIARLNDLRAAPGESAGTFLEGFRNVRSARRDPVGLLRLATFLPQTYRALRWIANRCCDRSTAYAPLVDSLYDNADRLPHADKRIRRKHVRAEVFAPVSLYLVSSLIVAIYVWSAHRDGILAAAPAAILAGIVSFYVKWLQRLLNPFFFSMQFGAVANAFIDGAFLPTGELVPLTFVVDRFLPAAMPNCSADLPSRCALESELWGLLIVGCFWIGTCAVVTTVAYLAEGETGP